MDATQIAAVVSAVTALVTAIGGVIAVIRHVSGPAHNPPSQNGPTTP